MKRQVLIIGIGPGDPELVTVQAVNALNKVDVFFIPDKGVEKGELARVRLEVIARYAGDRRFRIVEYKTPARRREDANYAGAVSDWHDELESEFGRLIRDELDESRVGAFLVWGDPTLYDSTMRILERLQKRGDLMLDYEVIAGISSVQALASKHKVALCDIGRSVLVSTGRTMAEGFPDHADSVVVMLNAEKALRVADRDLDIYWGAYVGMPDEVLVSGRLNEVIDDIERVREDARRRKGWIMDAVLMKRARQKVSQS